MDSIAQNNVLIIVGGPTGIGKTTLGIQLAKHYHADVFSADSRQLYKELTIGTAKPAIHEMEKVIHHFIDRISITEHYNAGIYEKEVLNDLDKYFLTNRIAIMVGGTGLYIQAVTDGLDKFPEIPDSVIQKISRDLSNNGIEFLQKNIISKDPDYAKKVDLQNPHRLIRALAVIEHTGESYSSFLNKPKEKRSFKPIFVNLDMDRTELYNRINIRVDQMIERGLLTEVNQLLTFKNLKSLQTVGYQELFDFMEGKYSLEEAVELIKQNSRRYAKRQLTWFRKDQRWQTFHPNNFDGIKQYVEDEIKGNITE